MQQQIVVHHDHLRAHQRLARLEIAALVEHRAVLAGARTCLRRYRAPQRGVGLLVQAVAVAVPGAAGQRIGHAFVEPDAGFAHFAGGRQFVVGKQVVVALVRPALARQAFELELAHIAPAPLGERKAKRLGICAASSGKSL
jgi:hypothetical protein